jgi:hypothetical protein
VNARLRILLLVVGVLGAPAWASAHHSWPVDTSKLVTVKGTVSVFTWANPHPMITLDVRAADGTIEQWNVGGPAISRMAANGWSKTTLKAGDVITGIGYQYANGAKVIRLERVVLADGRTLLVYARR